MSGVPAETNTGAAVFREPVVDPLGNVVGYAVRAAERVSHVPQQRGEQENAHAQYGRLDLPRLVADRRIFLAATAPMITGEVPLPVTASLVVEVPFAFAYRPDAAEHLRSLRTRASVALAEFVGDPTQCDLLDLADYVKIDVTSDDVRPAVLVERAHERGALVVATGVRDAAAAQQYVDQGVDLLQVPPFHRSGARRKGRTSGALQCLEVLRLLGTPEVDHERVARTIGADPELTVRVLRLVNSSVVPVRHHIDSVLQAVVLLGPEQLSALAMASLIDAESHPVDALWFILARALACRALSDETGYTVGLLSGAETFLDLAPGEMVARANVSRSIAVAVRERSGPYGPVLAAVLAHEAGDAEAVEATGLSTFEVAHAYVGAVADALAIATALVDHQTA